MIVLRFLADHCISNTIIETLRREGHEVIRVRDVLPVESPDNLVIAKAQELDAILLSLNGDFADIVTYPPGEYKGIVALQLKNHPEILDTLLSRLTMYLRVQKSADYFRGKLIVAEVNRIRVRS